MTDVVAVTKFTEDGRAALYALSVESEGVSLWFGGE